MVGLQYMEFRRENRKGWVDGGWGDGAGGICAGVWRWLSCKAHEPSLHALQG